jgi:hypothetical protein
MKEGWLVICWFCQEALGRHFIKLSNKVDRTSFGGRGRGGGHFLFHQVVKCHNFIKRYIISR